jgi:hypothetical protein
MLFVVSCRRVVVWITVDRSQSQRKGKPCPNVPEFAHGKCGTDWQRNHELCYCEHPVCPVVSRSWDHFLFC